MIDFESRRVIEALRSGVPSRMIGEHFSSARPELLAEISGRLDENPSGGMIISGKYGEGKTHLLNTVFTMAHKKNMAVSIISLSKETPFDKLHLVYQKLATNTYLPEHLQPGFDHIFESMSANAPLTMDMLLFAGKQLQTDKLYFLLRSYLNTEDPDERFALLSDIEGNFISNAELKKIYKRIFCEKAAYSVNFSKTKHTGDYIEFISKVFAKTGLNGWVIMFDETELIGRLGKKARQNAYLNMARFLMPGLRDVFALFAMSASYAEDVIYSKHERENLTELEETDRGTIEQILTMIETAPQLVPLNKDELAGVLAKIRDFHGRAYNWEPPIDVDGLLNETESRGYLLRTRIRMAIEVLDQLYQYGSVGAMTVGDLGQENYQEELPLPEELRG